MTDLHVDTRLTRDDALVPSGFHSLVRPTYRASTIVFESSKAFLERGAHFFDGYTYGLAGTPTHYALASQLAGIEGAKHCVLASSGLAAVHLVNQAVLRSGDHVLIPSSSYGPTLNNAKDILEANGVRAEFYDPSIGKDIAARFTQHTRLVWTESPGSLTMDIQDVPAIVEAAHAHDVKVAIDNTWASPLFFDALGHGVDYSVQALTKYPSGHSDVLLGSVCVNNTAAFRRLRTVADLIGMNVAPDDCAAVMRGLGTMSLRLQRHQSSALEIARWLEQEPAVERVLYPALPSDSGHHIWKRDFTGSSGLLSVLLRPGTLADSSRFVDALKLFRIGASWGGIQSLAALYALTEAQRSALRSEAQSLVRLHIGLEAPADLIKDLAQALHSPR